MGVGVVVVDPLPLTAVVVGREGSWVTGGRVDVGVEVGGRGVNVGTMVELGTL